MARAPRQIGNILSELMSRHGYGRVQSTEQYEARWREAAGPLIAKYTRIGPLRRGTFEVIVANSTLMQELTFRKADLLESMTKLLPDEGIKNIRFRVGAIE